MDDDELRHQVDDMDAQYKKETAEQQAVGKSIPTRLWVSFDMSDDQAVWAQYELRLRGHHTVIVMSGDMWAKATGEEDWRWPQD